ncbi:MAG: hypothetical protein EB059_04930 [Alphaproteobacteria bacterium]|nr:hypothetical protein [Alphaproteobacteria bacterium]
MIFMRQSYLLALLVVISLWGMHPGNLLAASEGCNNYTLTDIDVQPIFDTIEYDFSKPMLTIKELSEKGKDGMHSEAWPVGLSTGEMYFRVATDTYKVRTGHNTFICGQLKAIHIEFGFQNNKIYVAKEFPKRSCPFRQVLGHEEKHKAVDRAILEKYSELARATFAETSKTIGVVKGASPTEIDDKISAAVNEQIEKISKEIKDDHSARQRDVDSKEEYQRVTDSCEGQTMQIVKQRLDLLETSYPGITKVSHTR